MFQEQATKESGQHAYRQEETRTTGYPVRTIGSDTAAGDYTMQMGMILQVLSPGVKYSKKADFCAKMSCVSSNSLEGLGGSTKENIVDYFFVLIRDGCDFMGHGKHNVKVWDWKEFGLPIFKPVCAGKRLALGAVSVSAGVIGGALVAAGITVIHVAAKGGCTTALNGIHHASLRMRKRSCVLLAVCRTITAKYIRHFEV
jgi:hypothetical protein